jgi:hypothetical protein
MATLYDDPFLSSPASEGSIFSSPSSTGGIGLSPAKRPSLMDEKRALIDKMGTGEKILSALGEFGAGVTGRASPLGSQVEANRRAKMQEVEELRGFVADLDNLTKLSEGLEEGSRGQLIDKIAEKWEAVQPGYGAAVKAVGHRPSLLANFQQIMPHLPTPVQELAKRDPRAFLKYAGSAEGIKALNQAADQPVLRTAGRKRDTLVMGWQKLVSPEKAKALMEDGVLTDAELMEVQQEIPEALRWTPEEQEAIKRTPLFWEGTGVLHGAKAQEVLAERAKRKPEGAESDIGKLKADLKAGRITQKEYDAKVAKLTHIPAGKDGEPNEADIVAREFKIGDDYARDTKKFAERRPLFDSVTDYMAKRGKDGKTSAGDASLMFAYAKMRDPNDRLAVAETRDLVKLGNIFERFGVSVTGILDKGETLPDRVAKDMYAEIRRTFTELNRQQGRVEEEYIKKTKDYKGNPDRVVRRLSIPDEQLNPKGGDKPKGDQPAAEEVKIINGVTYRKVRGQWYESR